MSAIVYIPETELLSPEQERKFKDLMDIAVNKIIASKPGCESIQYSLYMKAPDLETNKIAKQKGKLTPQEVQHFQTALEAPSELLGTLIFSVEDKVVLHVEDGEVICDSLEIIPEVQKQALDSLTEEAYRKIAGQDLLPYIERMLKICGQKTQEGELIQSGKNYIYTQKDDSIKVVTKAEGKEILNSHGFTQAASNKDITAMHSFKQVAQEIATSQNLTNPQPKFKL